MPRQNSIKRAPGRKVVVCIDSVQHTLTETAFVDLMADGYAVLRAIEESHLQGEQASSRTKSRTTV